jgi:hypothetical protein
MKKNENQKGDFDKTLFLSKLYKTKRPNLIKKVPPEFQQDLNFMIEVVSNCPSCYQYIPEEMKENEEIILISLKFNESLGEFIPKKLISKSFIKKLMEAGVSAHIIGMLPKEDHFDRIFLVECIKINKTTFGFCYDKFSQDTEFISLALKTNGMNLKYISKEYQKKNSEILLIAAQENFHSFQFSNQNFKEDEEFLPQIFKINGLCLKYSSPEIQNSKSMVKVAINQNPKSIQFASIDLKNDKELLTLCVLEDGLCLEYASEELQRDSEIVFKAIKNNVESFKFSNLNDSDWNEDSLISIVQQNGFLLEYASNKFKENFNISLEALKQVEKNVSLELTQKQLFKEKILDEKLKKDDKFIHEALNIDKHFFDFVSDFSILHKDTLLRAIGKEKLNFKHIFLNLNISNKPYYSEFVELFRNLFNANDYEYFWMIPYLENDKKFLLKFCQKYKGAFSTITRFTNMELTDDQEFVLEIIRHDNFALPYASERLKDDKLFVMEAVKHGAKLEHVY